MFVICSFCRLVDIYIYRVFVHIVSFVSQIVTVITYEQLLQLTVGLGLHPAKAVYKLATSLLVVSTSLRLEADIDKPTNEHPAAFCAPTLLVVELPLTSRLIKESTKNSR